MNERYIVRYKGSEEALAKRKTIREAREDVKEFKKEDLISRELFFYEIYDTLEKKIVN